MAEAQAQRVAAAESGAEAIFEQIPTKDVRQTLHVIHTSDAPEDGRVILLYSPKGLESDAWDRLMFAALSLWRKIERAHHDGTLATLDPALVNLYNAGLGVLVVATAAAMNLEVRLVNRSAWHETTFAD